MQQTQTLIVDFVQEKNRVVNQLRRCLSDFFGFIRLMRTWFDELRGFLV